MSACPACRVVSLVMWYPPKRTGLLVHGPGGTDVEITGRADVHVAVGRRGAVAGNDLFGRLILRDRHAHVGIRVLGVAGGVAASPRPALPAFSGRRTG